MGVIRLALVRKYHYSKHTKGENLRKLINKHKYRTELSARTKAKSSPRKFLKYMEEILLFSGGNDAILEYIPNGNHSKARIFCANSSVNEKTSTFANIRIYKTGEYVLIPPRKMQNFSYITTNREREVGCGHIRENDTEYKLLEKIASIIGNTDIGHINLYTYYEPCL